jgi:hypothetical protein
MGSLDDLQHHQPRQHRAGTDQDNHQQPQGLTGLAGAALLG